MRMTSFLSSATIVFKCGQYLFNLDFPPFTDRISGFSVNTLYINGVVFGSYNEKNRPHSQNLEKTHCAEAYWVWCISGSGLGLTIGTVPGQELVTDFYIVDCENGRIFDGRDRIWLSTMSPSELRLFYM
jgi:hypothetical protein